MRIPFDIKYRPQIESGEYKVETKSGFPAKIIHCDGYGEAPILVTVDLGDGCGAQTRLYFANGKLYKEESDADLFIVTPEPEMTEFEKAFLERVFHQKAEELDEENREIFREDARCVLELARDQFIKDGYVIEKKAFHDAVEKVSQEVMKEVSENVDKTNEKLTEFERELESFYNHHLQVCTYDNQGTVEDSLHDGASKLLALARKDLCDQIVDHTKKAYENGKADALKDLPRWISDWKTSMVDKPDIIGQYLYYKEHKIRISDLEKLPGFKEDEK